MSYEHRDMYSHPGAQNVISPYGPRLRSTFAFGPTLI